MNRDKWIFLTDVDDTLLNTDKSLGSENKEALIRFMREGNYAAINTGRATEGIRRLMIDLGLYDNPNLILCGFNGGQIYSVGEEKTLYSKTIPIPIVAEAFALAKQFGIHIQTYSDTEVISERDTEDLHIYMSIQRLDMRIVPDIAASGINPPVKILAIDYKNPERITSFRKIAEEHFKGRLDCFQSNEFLLEMMLPGINKGYALHILSEHYGIPIERTIAAGDAENDITMIREAGIGCAMKNADERLKKIADYITEHDNNHAGVAEILDRFYFSRK